MWLYFPVDKSLRPGLFSHTVNIRYGVHETIITVCKPLQNENLYLILSKFRYRLKWEWGSNYTKELTLSFVERTVLNINERGSLST